MDATVFVTDRKKSRRLHSFDVTITKNENCNDLASPLVKNCMDNLEGLSLETPKKDASFASSVKTKETIIDSVTPSLPFSSCPKEPAEDVQKKFCLSFDESDSDQGSPNLFVSSKPLEGTLIFVDVRAENENRSKAISRELGKLGAKIADKISNQVTHVVYKDGRQSTLTQMRKYPHIHFVSVLWVDSCKTTKCKVNESLFKAKLPWDVDSPLPIGRAKRIKSLQPKTFEEDVRNSAKKEERKRRRLRRINPEGETPHRDEIICLDSQEYIKSSDLYKLVATPRAVPDTPWIFHYINGSADKTGFTKDGEHQSEMEDEPISIETKSIQCRLDFHQDEENEQIEQEADKENSPVRNRKGGPTVCKDVEVEPDGITHFEFKRHTILKEVLPKTPKLKKKNKVEFAMRTSLSRRKSSRLSRSPFKKTPIPQKNYSREPLESLSGEVLFRGQELNRNIADDFDNSDYEGASEGQFEVRVTRESQSMSNIDVDDSLVNHDQEVDKSFATANIDNKSQNEPETSRISRTLENPNVSIQGIIMKHLGEKGLVDKEDNNHRKKMQMSFNQSLLNDCAEKHHTVSLNTSGIGTKKKRKLLSKKLMNTPCDRLISPHIKGKEEESGYFAKETDKVLDSLGKTFVRCSLQSNSNSSYPSQMKTNKNIPPSADLHLSNEMINVKGNRTIAASTDLNQPDENINSTDFPNFTKLTSKSRTKHNQSKLGVSKLNLESVIESPVMVKNQQADCVKDPKNVRRISERIREYNRRSSGADFKLSKSYRRLNSKSKSAITSQESSSQSSSIESSFPVTEDTVNGSFIHDENDGLICLSQESGTPELNDSLRVDELANDGELEFPTENIHTRDIDSGISDSEELKDDSQISCETEQLNENMDSLEEGNKRTKPGDLEKPLINKHAELNSSRNRSVRGQSKQRRLKALKKVSKTTIKSNTTLCKTSKPKVSLVATSLHFSEQDFVKAVVKQMGGFVFRNNVTTDTTHLIVGNNRRTLNTLHGMIKGCWFLSPKWVSDSYEKGEWVSEAPYEVGEEFATAKVSRINRLRNSESSHGKLLSKLPWIYLSEVTCPAYEEMVRLITSCGGQLTTSIRKAGIGIGLISCRRKNLKIVSEKWILDSISNCRIMPINDYVMAVPSHRDTSPSF